MEGFLGHQLICRTCLRIVENKTQSFGFIEDANGNLKDMIMCCVPEMDIYVSSNPIICFPCIQLLVNVYNFKTRCLNTETIIRSYIQRNNLSEYNHVNLSCIVEELIRVNNYFRSMPPNQNDMERQNPNSIPNVPCGVPQSMPASQVNNEFNALNGQNNPNSIPHVPYGVPQGIPAYQFSSLNGPTNGALLMDHENLLKKEQLERRYQDSNVGVGENQAEKEHQFTLRHLVSSAIDKHQSMLQSMPVHQNVTLHQKHMETNHDETLNTKAPKEKNMHNTENLKENCQSSNSDGTVSESSITTEKAKDECERLMDLPPEEAVKETGKTTDDQKDTKENGKKKNITENRPRLIIRISKNKITIPTDKNEDSNEKENEEMDVEMNSSEMPPPEVVPCEPYQPRDNEPELYQCSNCMFVTTNLNYYISHKNNCTNDLTEKKCPHCPHVTNRQYALNKHINTMHTKSVWYYCDFCSYRSTDSSCLRRHKRNVHPEKLVNDIVCHLCSYRCSTEYHFKKHLMKHQESTTLQCQFCSYSSKDRSNFRKHVFTHNPRAQDCEFCDYKCVSPYQMKLHLKKLHNGVGMEDIDCRSEVSISEVIEDISAAIKAKEKNTQPVE